MSHIYKCSEWQTITGKWYCNDVEDLAGISSKWWVPARMLNISLTDYIILLKDKFKANIDSYYKPTDLLLFSWKNHEDCHKYVLFINSVARKTNFMV